MADVHVHPQGDDANPGGNSDPVKTIARAQALARRGDAIKVAPGEYLGFAEFRPEIHFIAATGPDWFKVPESDRPHKRPVVRLTQAPGRLEVIRYDLSGAPEADRVGGTIAGFELFGGTRANLYASHFHGGRIYDLYGSDGGRWGVLTGHSDRMHVHHNYFVRSLAEHGIYVSDSTHDNLIEFNVTDETSAAGIQINPHLGSGEGDGKGTRNAVKFNYCRNTGRISGPGMNFDGPIDNVIEGNCLECLRAGINLHQTNGATVPTGNRVVGNRIRARWPINVNSGAVNTEVTGNVLSAMGGGVHIDTNAPAVNLVREPNTYLTGESPFTAVQEQFFASLPAVEVIQPPPPPPPPPVVPPPPPLAPFDGLGAVTPTPMPAADVDTANQRAVLLQKWDRNDNAGSDQDSWEVWTPSGYHNYSTPGNPSYGVADGGAGFRVSAAIKFPRADAIQFRAGFASSHDFTVGEVTFADGRSPNGDDVVNYLAALEVTSTDFYGFEYGVVSSGSWLYSDIQYRWKGESEFKPVPNGWLHPVAWRPTTVPPVPPVPPVVPPPPPTGVGAIWDHPDYPKLMKAIHGG
jgi:hypothetical protein